MKVLRLNTAAIKADYITHMSKCLDEIAYGYFNGVVSAMNTESGKSDVTVEGKDEETKLVRYIVAGAFAVMDSFGTGSLADKNNPAWEEYANSDMYNPARPKAPGTPIMGRPKGQYTDIFGDTEYSSGKMEGVNLETLPKSYIKPMSPSGAIQDQNSWFKAEDTMIETIDKYTREFFASVFRSPGKYFKFG